ncbi:DUF7002 family protein [Rubripirellula reticaptiva]
MTLESAGRLLELGSKQEWLRKRREEMLPFRIGDDQVVLTDQRPLTAGNVDFQDGWDVSDLVESVNRRVFFWRGNHDGLLSKDRGHFGTYSERGEQLVFLRIPFGDAVAITENSNPEYCRFNSGGPRCSGGKKSPRGPRTFMEANQADFTFGKVREVVFRDVFYLPDSTEICHGSWEGEWQIFRFDDVQRDQQTNEATR